MEDAFLGSTILSSGSEWLMGLSEDNFLSIENKKIFSAIQSILSNSESLDLMTLRSKLEDNWELEYVGWNQKLISLVELPVSQSSILHYANKIKSESKRVEIMKVAKDLSYRAEAWLVEPSDIITYADKLIDINTSMNWSEYSLDSIIEDTMGYILSRNWKKLFGHSFWENLSFFDTFTKWIQKWRTYRLGAVSNLGKSQLAYNMIVNLLDQWVKVAFFTLENEKAFTITNILANKFWVNTHQIEDWSFCPDFGWLEKFRHQFYLIDEEYDLSRIFAKCLEIKPDVVFIDYIGLISINRINEEDKYTVYSKKVQEFVKKTQLSWIDLSNLPKDADEDNIRMYWGYYGSSFLRNNADVGIHMFYYKPFYEWKKSLWQLVDNEKIRNIKVITMLISKNRIWTAQVEQVFKIDFNKWWRFIQATEEDFNLWAF